jgi:hypothetical protein
MVMIDATVADLRKRREAHLGGLLDLEADVRSASQTAAAWMSRVEPE